MSENIDFVVMCQTLRAATGDLEDRLQEHIEDTKTLEVDNFSNKGEMIANLMLAYRHLEDSRMRLGKAIQAHDGGVSIYDKAKT